MSLRSRFIDSQMIERSIKRGFKLSQTVRSLREIVIPVELEFVSKKLGPGCRLLRIKAIQYLFKQVFESPEEDKWGELHLIRQIRDRFELNA